MSETRPTLTEHASLMADEDLGNGFCFVFFSSVWIS